MDSLVGIGYSSSSDSREAGVMAALEASRAVGGVENVALLLSFASGFHDQEKFFSGLRSVVADAPVIGGSALGIMTSSELSYESFQGVAVAFDANKVSVDIAIAKEIDRSEYEAGLKIGRIRKLFSGEKRFLDLLFYDSLRSPAPELKLNSSFPLIKGFLEECGENHILAGAGLLGSYDFTRSSIFNSTEVARQSAVLASFRGDLKAYIDITHGARPVSDYHTITKIEGPVVYEIDGQPAMDVIDRIFGSDAWQKKLPVLLLTLGVNYGSRFGPYNEENYVNRLIINVRKEEKAIVLFEADLSEGTEFQFMRRNERLMIESAREVSKRVINKLSENDEEGLFSLYIDCAGRTRGFCSGEIEEGSIVQEIIGKKMPFVGFYSGVEIAPLLGRPRGLDWTGVIVTFAKKKSQKASRGPEKHGN